jgi:capsid assembly protease
MMKFHEILSATPMALARIDDAYRQFLSGDPLAARAGKQMLAPRPKMSVEAGTALITMSGILWRGAGPLGELLGACDPSAIQGEIEAAASDPGVQRIILLCDSPGGSIAGIQQCSDALFAAGGIKDTVAIADSMCCSAAYWIASAARTLLVADATAQVGSIGVIARHVDQSGADSARGLKVTEVKAGKYKAVGSAHKALSPDDLAQIQALVDQTHETFLQAVARGRGASPQEARNMGDGKIHQGQSAVDAGLADGIGTLDQVLSRPPRRVSAQQAAQAPATVAAASTATGSIDPLEVAAKAREYIDAQAKLGRTVSAAEAVQHVSGHTSNEVRRPQLAEHKPPTVVLDAHVAAAWARAYIDQEAAAGRRVSAAEAVREFQRSQEQ